MISTKLRRRSRVNPCVAFVCGMMALSSAVSNTAIAQPPDNPDAVVLPKLQTKVNQLIDEISEAEVELEVKMRRSKLMRTKVDIMRVAIADPGLIEIVAFGTREVEIIGKTTGSTTMTLWLGNAQQSKVLSVLVTVVHDTSVDDRRRMEYGELQTMINELFPNSKIQLFPVADKLIVRGEARDSEEATRIMSILRKQGMGGGGGGFGGGFMGGGGLSQGAAAEPFPDAGTLPQSNIISLLEVPGEMQVMLKVRIAELKRSAVRNLSVKFDFNIKDFFFSSGFGGGGTIVTSATFGDDGFNLFINALAQNGVAKILAEPNLVTLSGRPATFLSGGEFAVPTVVGVGGVQAVSTSFKGFGTSLVFTPNVIDKDRIRLTVVPTFSTLNKNNSVGGVFGLDTRTTSTTVDLREGQTLAIAGLIQSQMRGDSSQIPLLGDLPLLAPLFRTKSTSSDETELIVVVTPEFVHPMEAPEVPPLLPGQDVTEPDNYEFYFKGRIEGNPNCQHRDTVWPLYKSRIRYGETVPGSQSEDYFISGPHGFSN